MHCQVKAGVISRVQLPGYNSSNGQLFTSSILVHTIEGVFSPELCCHGDCCVDTVELCKAAEEEGYSSFLGSCLVALVKKARQGGLDVIIELL